MAADPKGASISRIPLLDGSNYYIWSYQMESVLDSKDLWTTVIQGDEPQPRQGAAWERWRRRNAVALSLIVTTLTPEQAGMRAGTRSAKQVWNDLAAHHGGRAEHRQVDIGRELTSSRMGPNEGIEQYIDRVITIAQRSAAAGRVIEESEIVYYMVRGLTSKYVHVARAFHAQRDLSIIELRRALRLESEWEEERKSRDNYSREGAYKAARGGMSSNRNASVKCFECGRMGHYARDCRQKAENSNNASTSGANNGNCYNCGKRGHFARDCRAKSRGQGAKTTKTTQREQGAAAHFACEPEVDGDVRTYAFCASVGDSELVRTDWLLDSGATTHMTSHREFLTDFVGTGGEIHLAQKEATMESEGYGTVRMVSDESDNLRMVLDGVTYAPDLRGSLLSVYALTRKGLRVIFEDDQAEIVSKSSGETVATASLKGKMYRLDARTRMDNGDNSDETEAVTMNENEEICEEKSDETDEYALINENKMADLKLLWHKRLGHMSDHRMGLVQAGKLIVGATYGTAPLPTCRACVSGRQPRRPFKRKKGGQRVARPLELWHADICGPFAPSLSGARYALVIIDDCTRYVYFSALREKAQAFEEIECHRKREERGTGLKVARIRTDNGGEFCSDQAEATWLECGVKHEKTVPYSPQSNGVVERYNRTIAEKTKVLLQWSMLPDRFWAEAMATAVYGINRTPTAARTDTTPFETRFGHKPGGMHLRPFGCVAHRHIPKQQRGKLDAVTKQGIMVGYATNRRAYRIYDEKDKKVYEVRDVYFEEGARESRLQQLRRQEMGEEGLTDILPDGDTPNEESDSSEGDDECDELRNDEVDNGANDGGMQIEAVAPIIRDAPPRRQGRPTRAETAARREEEVARNQEREQQLEEQGVRRSARIREQHAAHVAGDAMPFTPATYEEAITCPDKLHWQEAMEQEMESLALHKVWRLGPRSSDKKPIKSKWVYRVKMHLDGSINKYKARLVAVGCAQRPGDDFDRTFAPVMKLESLRLLLAIAAKKKLKVRHYDVVTAYLHGHLEEVIHMQQPKGFAEEGAEELVCILQKSLYGLKQSGRCWNKELDKSLKAAGMKRLFGDPCLYTCFTEEDYFAMGVFVDDMVVVGSTDEYIEAKMAELLKYFKLVDLGVPTHLLGMRIEVTKRGIRISQEEYAQKILKRFGMEACKRKRLPLPTDQNLDETKDSNSADKKIYQEMLGSLMYLMLGTRPDLAYSISRLATYSSDPKIMHLNALRRVMQYVQATLKYAIYFDRKEGPLQLFSDASWSTSREARSYSGYLVLYGGSPVSWRTRKQRLVALSSCEAEMIALSEGLKELKWFRGVVAELEVAQVQIGLEMFCDSESTIAIAEEVSQLDRTKHILRKYMFVREEIDLGNVKLCFLPTDQMIADPLTKPVTGEKLRKLAERLKMGSMG